MTRTGFAAVALGPSTISAIINSSSDMHLVIRFLGGVVHVPTVLDLLATVQTHTGDTDTQTHRHTDTQTHRHTDTQAHRHTDTQTQTQTATDRWRRGTRADNAAASTKAPTHTVGASRLRIANIATWSIIRTKNRESSYHMKLTAAHVSGSRRESRC